LASAKTLDARYTLTPYKLTVTTPGSGSPTGSGSVSSSPAGIDACNLAANGTSTCNQSYDYGTSVTLTAAPAVGSMVNWSGGGCSGNLVTCTVTVTATTTVAATFSRRGILYVINDVTDKLRRIDLYSPYTVTDVGNLNISYQYGDCAWDPSAGSLYMVEGGSTAKTLYKIDTSTGAATAVGAHNVASMRGLANLPADATYLYGISDSGVLYKIKKTAGAATTFYQSGISSINGLVYDPVAGYFVALTKSTTAASVYKIATATGVPTLMSGTAAGVVDYNGLTYDAIAARFLAVDYSGSLFQYPSNFSSRTTLKSGLGFESCVAYVP
jgi:hypothetical protein